MRKIRRTGGAINMGYAAKLGSSSSPTLVRTTIGSNNSLANRTFNVANILPNIYTKLTKDNFGIDTYMYKASASTSDALSYRIIGSGNYNASTGVLTCYQCHPKATGSPHVCQYTVYCWHIE